MPRRLKTAEPFKGRLQISRTSGDRECIMIQVEDKTSGCLLLELDVELEAFARALTNQSIECAGTAYMGCPVNAKYEHRQIPIVVDKLTYSVARDQRSKIAAEILRPHEVDGWRGTPDDLWNGHRHVERSKPRAHDVTFFRWVDPQTGEPIAD